MADSSLIREALKKRGLMPDEEIDALLGTAPAPSSGYAEIDKIDAAERAGELSPEAAGRARQSFIDANPTVTREVFGDDAVDTRDADGIPFGHWDDAPGITPEEAARLRQEQLDKTPGLSARLFGDGAETPTRWEGETDEEFAARTAPLERTKPMQASGPAPKFAASGPSPKAPEMIAMAPEFRGASSEIGPIVQNIEPIELGRLPAAPAAPVARQFSGRFSPGAVAANVESARTLSKDLGAEEDPGRPARSGADAPPMPQDVMPARSQMTVPAPRRGAGGGALLQSEKNLRGAYSANQQKLVALGDAADKVTRRQMAAEDTLANEAIAKNEAAAKIREDAQRRATEERARRLEAEERQQKIFENDQAKLAQMREELGNMKVEDRRGFGRRLGGAIAMALGAYGAALTGGKNTAAEIVMQSIQDDLQAQREAVSNKRASYGEAKNLYREALEKFGSDRHAMIASELGLLDEAERKIDAMIKGNTNPEILANAEKVKMSLVDKKLGLEREAANESLNTSVKVEGQIANIAAERQKLAQSAAAKVDEQGRIPGLVGTGINKQATGEAANMWGAGKAVLDQFADLKSFVFGGSGKEGVGAEVSNSDDARTAKAKAASLRIELAKNILDLGVLTKQDMEDVNAMIPEDPTQLRQGAAKKQIDEAEAYVRRKITAHLYARGYAIESTRPTEVAPVK
jgi:hypothetical protein